VPIPAEKALEELFKFRLAQLRSDSEYATTTISQNVRVVAYGLVALIVPLATAEPARVPAVVSQYSLWVFLASLLGGVAVFCDGLQNHIVDNVARDEFQRLAKNLKEKDLVVTSPADFMASSNQSAKSEFRVQLYLLKIIFTAVGVLIMFVVVFAALVAH
jgi:hypothetical protein